MRNPIPGGARGCCPLYWGGAGGAAPTTRGSRWWAPYAISAQVPLVQVHVHLGYASVLGLGLGVLERSWPSTPPPLWYLYYNATESHEMVGFIRCFLNLNLI